MWAQIYYVLKVIDDKIWGVPLMLLILSGGFLLTARLGLLQFRRLPLALHYVFHNEESKSGEVTSFQALCTALSATIGTGNIVGVATAVTTGGPGALFWMVLAACVGMATKYAECLLSVKYRVVDEKGHALGGPFYYIERGMGPKWKWLAVLFAFLGTCVGLFGIGTFSQVNGIVSAIQNFFDPDKRTTVTVPGIGEYSVVVVVASLILAMFVAFVVIGGLKRIAHVAEVIVPFMAILYFSFAVLLILFNITRVPAAFVQIISAAFDPKAVTGGVVGSMLVAMQKGVARGIFSNEAGLGSAPIAAAAAQTEEPVRQGLVSMTGTFLDTIIICNLTGLSIVITGAWKQPGLEGVQVTTYAFQHGLPFPPAVSSFVLMACLIFFAFTTILGWDYYSERCIEYLSGGNMKPVRIFRVLYIIAVFIGPYMDFPDGSVYKGTSRKKKLTGKGTMTYSNGDMYKGTFVNGKRSGNGKYTWANKAVYRGKWEKDKMNGTGTYYYEPTSRGKKLTGKWKNNAPNGTCYYWARTKNKKYTTTWKSGKCVKVKG